MFVYTLQNAVEGDMVQNQYTLLPYPPFSNIQLNNEERFYKSELGVNQAFEFIPCIALEKLNHFLFKGKQNFR